MLLSPLTPKLLRLAAALLRKGAYRSASIYLSAIRRAHIVEGFAWTEALDLELKDCTRAVRRGLGPAKQA